MQIGEWLSQIGGFPTGTDPARQDGTPPGAVHPGGGLPALGRARLEALLPTSGIQTGPPDTEDRLDISPLAHAILRANVELDGAETERAGLLRIAYFDGSWEPDAGQIALRLLSAPDIDPVSGTLSG